MLEVFVKKDVQKQQLEVFYQKGFLKISQNSQENTCARVCFLIELQASGSNFFINISKKSLSWLVWSIIRGVVKREGGLLPFPT